MTKSKVITVSFYNTASTGTSHKEKLCKGDGETYFYFRYYLKEKILPKKKIFYGLFKSAFLSPKFQSFSDHDIIKKASPKLVKYFFSGRSAQNYLTVLMQMVEIERSFFFTFINRG